MNDQARFEAWVLAFKLISGFVTVLVSVIVVLFRHYTFLERKASENSLGKTKAQEFKDSQERIERRLDELERNDRIDHEDIQGLKRDLRELFLNITKNWLGIKK